MVSRKNTLMAVFAVALMLGCGIVPLFSSQSADGAITVTQNDKSADGMTLSDIIEKIRTIGDAESFEFGDMVFVKVDDGTVGEEKTIPAVIGDDGKNFVIGDGDFAVLGKGNTEYQFTNSKYIEIMGGGKLVVFPLDADNHGFTLVNHNGEDADFERMVIAHSGALISFFGVTFKIAYQDDGVLGEMCQPFGLAYNCAAAKKEHVDPKAVFSYGYGTGESGNGFELKVSVNYVGKLLIFRGIIDGKEILPPAVADPDIVVNGNIECDSRTGEVKISDATVHLDYRHGGDTTKADLKIEYLNVRCGYSVSGNTTVNEGKISFKIIVDSFVFSIANDKIVISIGQQKNGDDYITGDFDFKIATDIGPTIKRNIQVESNKPLELNLYYVSAKLNKDIENGITADLSFTATGLTLKIDSVSVDVNVVRDSGKWKMMNGTADANVSFHANYLNIDGEIELSFIILAFSFVEFKDVSLSANVSADMTDGKNWTVKSDRVTAGATIAKILPTKKYGENPIFGNYEIGIEANVAGFVMTMNEGVPTYRGNVNIALATTNNGLLKTLVLTAENATVSRAQDGSYDVIIGKIYLNNGLPLKSILKNFKDLKLVDNMEIELEVKNLAYNTSEHIYSADSMWMHYRNFSISDDVYVSLNSKVTYQYKSSADKYVFSCDSITGYLKDRDADKEQFAITPLGAAGHAKIAISRYTMEGNSSLLFNLYICEGKAVFGKGYLPVYLHVASGVVFTADGLSAYKMSFERGSVTNGYVSVDASDGIHYSTSSFNNIREIYYDYMYGENDTTKAIYVNCLTDFGSNMGCTVYIDISDFSKGKAVANEHFSIEEKPDATDGIVYGDPSGDHKSVEFAIDNGLRHVFRAPFQGDGPYWVTIDGKTLIIPAEYNSKISYHDPDWSPSVIGLMDDTGKIYLRNPENYDQVTFFMPARDINLVSVESTPVAPVTKGGEAVIDARGADVVQIHAEAVEADTVRILVTGAEIDMTATTFNSIVNEVVRRGFEAMYFDVSEMKSSDVEAVQKSIEGKTAFNINMKDGKGNDVTYDGSTVFEVTVKVKVSGDISGFKATYVNEYGQTESVRVKSYESLGNREYAVTFETNHFSTYAIEPVEYSNSNATLIAIIAITVVVALAVGATLYMVSSRGRV